MAAKVENKTTPVKVVVNDVKSQIMAVKRPLHKYLVEQGIAAKDSTVTKPRVIAGITEKQQQAIQKELKTITTEMWKRYKHSTPEQITYVENHLFNVHTPKYLK